MSNTIFLRQATTADASAIQSLTRQAYGKWVAVAGREPKPMTADYNLAVRNHRIDLLCSGDALIGLIEMIPAIDHLLIENVAVAPAFQGNGFGRRLLTNAEHVAATLGYGLIRLYTNKLFTENIELYSRFGYRIDREEVLGARTAVHMSKPVQSTRRPAESR